jgi:hypothetical protein
MGRGRKRLRRKPTITAADWNAEHVVPAVGQPPAAVDASVAKAILTFGEWRPDIKDYKVDLVQVPPEDVEEIWPLAESLLAHELPSTDWTAEQLLIACLNGVATLWMVCDQDDNAQAAMVTILTPKQRCLVAICCGNNLWNYLEARHQLYDWAREQGMKEVTFYGRDALVKLMPECKRAGVILRKEL